MQRKLMFSWKDLLVFITLYPTKQIPFHLGGGMLISCKWLTMTIHTRMHMYAYVSLDKKFYSMFTLSTIRETYL